MLSIEYVTSDGDYHHYRIVSADWSQPFLIRKDVPSYEALEELVAVLPRLSRQMKADVEYAEKVRAA